MQQQSLPLSCFDFIKKMEKNPSAAAAVVSQINRTHFVCNYLFVSSFLFAYFVLR